MFDNIKFWIWSLTPKYPVSMLNNLELGAYPPPPKYSVNIMLNNFEYRP